MAFSMLGFSSATVLTGLPKSRAVVQLPGVPQCFRMRSSPGWTSLESVVG
jgi:hypothetical protein